MIGARRLASRIALASVIAIAAAGCHKKVPAAAPAPPPPPPTAPATPPRPTPPPPPPTPVPAPRPLSDEEIFARKSVDQFNAERPLDDVFFDLDKSEIREDATSALQKDADWLKKFTSTQITLEGHCDSRGSAEYQPGVRCTPLGRGEGLSPEPGHPGGPRHGDQQGQRAAVLQRRERVLLAAGTGADTS